MNAASVPVGGDKCLAVVHELPLSCLSAPFHMVPRTFSRIDLEVLNSDRVAKDTEVMSPWTLILNQW